MSLWEYKIITSGKGGFARPDLLEKFLNDLGRDEWEIIEFHTAPDNFLVFTGLARRLTQRDWTLEDAAATAAKVEAEKLRAEFEAKFKAATAPAPVEERPADFLQEKVAPDDGFRKPVDTSHDADPDAEEEEKDEWEKLTAEEDELPTFFEAIKPHMRRNQRGPGMSVGVDYLAKKWDQSEDDLKNALAECGFVVPEDEDAKAEYLEYDGDLYWLNVNRRGELWINTKEKPRPVFRPVKAQKIAVEEDRKPDDRAKKSAEESGKSEDARQAEAAERKSDEGQPAEPAAEGTEQPAAESTGKPAKPEGAAAELPQGAALLKKIRPHMRRNRRGPGGSGSTSFLSRALKTSEQDLKAAFAALGLKIPTSANEKPSYLEIGNEVWWLNADSRGGMWINGREKRAGEIIAPTPDESGGEQPAAGGVEAGPGQEAVPAVDEGGAEAAAAGTGELAAVAGTTNATGAESLPAGEPAADNREQQPLTPAGPNSATEMAAPVAPVLTNGPQAGETGPAAGTQPVAADQAGVLTGLRPLLKETRTGTAAARLDRLAEETGKSADELMAALVAAGLKVPEKPREKSVLIEHGGEVLWLNRNAKSELWLNAKASKLADMKEDEEDAEREGSGEDEEPDSEKKAKRSRTRKKPENESA